MTLIYRNPILLKKSPKSPHPLFKFKFIFILENFHFFIYTDCDKVCVNQIVQIELIGISKLVKEHKKI